MNEGGDGIIPEVEVPSPAPETPAAASSRTKRRSIAIAIVVGGLCVLVCWRFGNPKLWFFALLPYAPVVIPSLLAIVTIFFKDWDNYRPSWVRWLLLTLVMAACIVGVAYQVNQRKENRANTDTLNGQVDAVQNAQDNNTKRFLASLQVLSDNVSDLQTKAATEALQTELATVKGELEKTQRALAPAPKATLVLTFPIFINPKAGERFIPLTEMTLPATAEGHIKVPFSVVNPTDADALDGFVNLFACNACKVAKDPNGFSHLTGTPETERHMDFQHLPASVGIPGMEIELIVPRSIQRFVIGMQYRCRTCVLHKEVETITVRVEWPK